MYSKRPHMSGGMVPKIAIHKSQLISWELYSDRLINQPKPVQISILLNPFHSSPKENPAKIALKKLDNM
jgi:hypothetical protein